MWRLGRTRSPGNVSGRWPAFSAHTLKTFGYLVGLLLVRGMERGERVLAAMKCRGFDGRFRTLEDSGFHPRDTLFTLAAGAMALTWLGTVILS